jgi:hypothetical protein
VSPKRAGGESLFATTWVHAFEEDTEKGAVYRPEDSEVPLSRRPRERIRVEPGGAAVLFMPGPDDRYVEQSATWEETDNVILIRTRQEGDEVRIVERSPTRLVVRMRRTGPAR